MGNNPSITSLSDTAPKSRPFKSLKKHQANPSNQSNSNYFPNESKIVAPKDPNNQEISSNPSKEVFVCQKVVDFNQDFLKRFRLNHPNLLKTFGFDLNTNYLTETNFSVGEHIFFEYAPKPIRQLIELRKPNKLLSDNDMRSFFRDMINVLSFLQENNISHGDIESSTVFFDENQETFKIYDHELLAGTNSGFGLTRQQMKWSYLAPELMIAFAYQPNLVYLEGRFFKSDVFSLGMVFLEVGCLKDSLDLYDFQKIIINKQMLNERLTFLTQFYSREVVNIINMMLEFDDKKRPDFIQLRNVLIQEGIICNVSPDGIPFQESINLQNEQQPLYNSRQNPEENNVYQQTLPKVYYNYNAESSQNYNQYVDEQSYNYNNLEKSHGQTQVKKIFYDSKTGEQVDAKDVIAQPNQQQPVFYHANAQATIPNIYNEKQSINKTDDLTYGELRRITPVQAKQVQQYQANPQMLIQKEAVQPQNQNYQNQNQVASQVHSQKPISYQVQTPSPIQIQPQHQPFQTQQESIQSHPGKSKFYLQHANNNNNPQNLKQESIHQTQSQSQFMKIQPVQTPIQFIHPTTMQPQPQTQQPKFRQQNEETYLRSLENKIKYVDQQNVQAGPITQVAKLLPANVFPQKTSGDKTTIVTTIHKENHGPKTEDKETKESLQRLRMEIMNSKKIIENYEKNKKEGQLLARKPFNEMVSYVNNEESQNINYKVENLDPKTNKNNLNVLKSTHKNIIERNKKLDERLEEVLRKSHAITKGVK